MSKGIYPDIEPYRKGEFLGEGNHRIYYEESGNESGYPVIFFHGGPGGRTRPFHRRYFDPSFYRIILMDQRGCGKSAPQGNVFKNTTDHLISDIEQLRNLLGVENWLIFGGSWGSTLALVYCLEHPERVSGLILRGVFLARSTEIEWYLKGIRSFIPEIVDSVSKGTVEDTIAYYHDRVFQENHDVAIKFAKQWGQYEMKIMEIGSTKPDISADDAFSEEEFMATKIQLHYMLNQCFIDGDKVLKESRDLNKPVIIIQGRVDMVCPPVTAFELAANLPNSDLRLIETGGHSGSQSVIAEALRIASDEFRQLLKI